MVKPIVISEVGYDYWKHCNEFSLGDDYDTPKNRAAVDRVKRTNSPYNQQDSKKTQKELPQKKTHKAITRGIQLGTVVQVRDITYGEIVKYKIVKPQDSDVLKGKISIDSPVGKGLIGAVEGDIRSISTPNGIMKYKILELKN